VNSPVTHARTINRRSLAAGIALTVAAGTLAKSASSVGAQDIQTRLQIVHAATEIGQVEVHINGDEVLDEFEYGDISDWMDLDPGTVRFTVTADRAGFNYVLLDVGYPVPAGNDYYVVITDALVLAGTFDTSDTMGDGSRVQITHASVDTPAVNVVASGENVDLATQLNYSKTSEGAVLPAGTYSMEVTLAESGESVLVQDGIVVETGQSYMAVLIGTPGDEDHPLQIVALSTDLSAASAVASPVS
jgi:hypothetical protein